MQTNKSDILFSRKHNIRIFYTLYSECLLIRQHLYCDNIDFVERILTTNGISRPQLLIFYFFVGSKLFYTPKNLFQIINFRNNCTINLTLLSFDFKIQNRDRTYRHVIVGDNPIHCAILILCLFTNIRYAT